MVLSSVNSLRLIQKQLQCLSFHTSGALNAKKLQTFEEATTAFSHIEHKITDQEAKLREKALFRQATRDDSTTINWPSTTATEEAEGSSWFHELSKKLAISRYIELVNGLVSQLNQHATLSDWPKNTEELTYDFLNNKVLRVQFNRPQKKNAITMEMYENWTALLQKAAGDPNVSMLAVTGTGDFFSSGNDFSSLKVAVNDIRVFDTTARQLLQTIERLIDTIIDFPKPLIALVNGPAIGIAATMLGLFDYILASDKAYFYTPFVKLGVSPEGCSSFTFPQILGPLKAKDVLLFGRQLSAEEAYAAGFVNKVTSDVNFVAEYHRLLSTLSELPCESFKSTKQVLRIRDRDTLHAVNKAEFEQIISRMTSKEFVQAMHNFGKPT